MSFTGHTFFSWTNSVTNSFVAAIHIIREISFVGACNTLSLFLTFKRWWATSNTSFNLYINLTSTYNCSAYFLLSVSSISAIFYLSPWPGYFAFHTSAPVYSLNVLTKGSHCNLGYISLCNSFCCAESHRAETPCAESAPNLYILVVRHSNCRTLK